MNHFGDTATRLLAMVAALMTATSGVPRVECVCPDGRVRLFCAGPPISGCCCAGTSTLDPAAAGHRRSAARGAWSCCAPVVKRAPTCPAGDGQARAERACGCESRLVGAPVSIVPEHAGAASQLGPGALPLWEVIAVSPGQAAWRVRVMLGTIGRPPDLVVLLCHFTC